MFRVSSFEFYVLRFTFCVLGQTKTIGANDIQNSKPKTRNSQLGRMTRFTIWTNALLTDEARRALTEGTQAHRLFIAEQPPDVLTKADRDPGVSGANVVFGQPDPADLIDSEQLSWVQISSAGYTRYDLPELKSAFLRRRVPLTNSSQVFAEPCAEHLMAWLLADGRQLYPAFE